MMIGKGLKRFLASLRTDRQPSLTIDPSKPVLSCVVDRQPKFLMQAWVWLVSARASGAFEHCNVVVHHVGPAPAVLKELTTHFGAQIIEIDPFGEGAARYCNKLQSHTPIISLGTAGAILTDVDLFFLASPHQCWSAKSVRAKIVDHPNPPVELLTQLSDRLGLTEPAYDGIPTFRPETRTHRLNSNGGLYAFSQAALKKLAPIWREFSTQCLSESDILGKWLHHSDQIGFMMSMIETGLPFEPLDLEWNFPTHFKAEAYEDNAMSDLKILHYHDKLSPEGRLMPMGVPELDQQIARANAILADHENLPAFRVIQSQYAASLQ